MYQVIGTRWQNSEGSVDPLPLRIVPKPSHLLWRGRNFCGSRNHNEYKVNTNLKCEILYKNSKNKHCIEADLHDPCQILGFLNDFLEISIFLDTLPQLLTPHSFHGRPTAPSIFLPGTSLLALNFYSLHWNLIFKISYSFQAFRFFVVCRISIYHINIDRIVDILTNFFALLTYK